MFRDLTRKNKQISEKECMDLLKMETRGVLSVLGDNDYPYGMPMNHWYNEEDGKIYFHCGNMKSHRTDAINRHDKVSYCVFNQGHREDGEWAWKVKSVIVFEKMEIVDDMDAIIDITTKLSYKFIQDDDYIKEEIEKYAHETLLLQLTPEHVCGKQITES